MAEAKAAAGGGKMKLPGQMDLKELEAHVARLELEARELEARERIHDARARFEKRRAGQAQSPKPKP